MLPTLPLQNFETVSTAYSQAIRKRIRCYVQDPAIVKDLQQEVLIKIWRKLPGFDHTKGSLFTWITIITIHTCIDHLRAMERQITSIRYPNETEEFLEKACEPDQRLQRRELLLFADKLSSCQKKILILIYFRGYTQSEVAVLLNLPLGTVKTRQRTAIIALRKMFTISTFN